MKIKIIPEYFLLSIFITLSILYFINDEPRIVIEYNK
jgi:hypothetical protein